jgi:GNAT superfamily N-acetyltransferase
MSRQSATFRPIWWPVRINAPARATRRAARRAQRWWVAKSLPFRRIDVHARTIGNDALVLEAFTGTLRLAKMLAVPTSQLPAEDWVDAVPRDHRLPVYWVAEFVVDPHFRGRGVGRRVVRKLAEVAFARHTDALIVGCAGSSQSRQFAAALGFSVAGEAAYTSLGGAAHRLLA